MVIKWLRSRLGGAGRRAAPPQQTPERPAGAVSEPDPLNPERTIYTYGPPQEPREPDSEAESFEAISDHVKRHVGDYEIVLHELVSEHVHVDVIPVPPSDTHAGWTFVTSGMSDLPMAPPEGAKACRYAELLIRLPANWPVPDLGAGDMSPWDDEAAYWPIRVLKGLALYPHRHGAWVWDGHTIALTDGVTPIAPGVGFTSILLTYPASLPTGFWNLPLSEDKQISFLTLIPLYPDETDYKRIHGMDALFDLMPEPELIEILDPHRPSLIPR